MLNLTEFVFKIKNVCTVKLLKNKVNKSCVSRLLKLCCFLGVKRLKIKEKMPMYHGLLHREYFSSNINDLTSVHITPYINITPAFCALMRAKHFLGR